MHLAIGGKKKKFKNMTLEIVIFKTGENAFALITTTTLEERSEILQIMLHHHFPDCASQFNVCNMLIHKHPLIPVCI